MDPSSPAKRRALAPLDANGPRVASQESHQDAIGSQETLAAVVFDENAVAKKKQCQEPAITVAAPASVSAIPPTPTPSTPVPAVVSKGTIASTSTSTSAPSPAASAQTEIDTEPDAQELMRCLFDRVRARNGNNNAKSRNWSANNKNNDSPKRCRSPASNISNGRR
ncbi:hypothetical protein ColKHC_03797 [Colletotrichum higginsianum]|nr:hypothetical protein ColKHC_03797 [Colletotrichum higginsianum]